MKTFRQDLVKFRTLFIFLIPCTVLLILFNYVPMFGIIIAFKDYRISRGFLGSDWVGFKHFINFFTTPSAFNVVRNTIILNVYGVLWGFWVPIVFAILLCELKGEKFRKAVQTVSYLPYFISTVIIASLVNMLLSIDNGPINVIRTALTGAEPLNFLVIPKYFRTIYITTNIWSGFGWSAIIYIAAIIGIDSQLYEAATVDGANALRRVWHITLPGIKNTIIILLLLSIGRLMSSAFELVFLLQKPLTYVVSDTISTYVYRRGIASASGIPEYSYTTAIGLFQSVVNVILLTTANFLSRKYSETSLF